MDLIRPSVGLLHGELVKFTGDVIGGAGIDVPIVVAAPIGVCRSCCSTSLGDVVFIKAVPAHCHCVPYLEAYLALRAGARVGAGSDVVGATV
jgi:hypothetical protein